MRWRRVGSRSVALMGMLAIAGCRSADQAVSRDSAPPDSHATADRPAGSDGGVPTDAIAPPDASVESGADSGTARTPADVCRAAIEAQCRRYAVCRGSDAVVCPTERCPEYYFNPRSLRTVSEIESCLDALGSMTCTDIAMSILPPCLRGGIGGGGATCLYNTECEFGCSRSEACGTCLAASRAATGDACDGSRRCATTDYCHTATRKCVPKASVVHAAEGEPCDFAAQPAVGCQGDLICARTTATSTAGTCRTLPQANEPCALDGDPRYGPICGPGLWCDSQTTTCLPLSSSPGGCGDGGACDVTSFCRAPAGPDATCVARALEGQKCTSALAAEPEVACVLGTRCVFDADGGRNGTCVALRALGEPCDETHPCGDSLCGVAGRCTTFHSAACQPDTADAGSD